jgi:hypothetical protein
MMIYMLSIVILIKKKKNIEMSLIFSFVMRNLTVIKYFFYEDFKFSVDSEIFKVCSF